MKQCEAMRKVFFVILVFLLAVPAGADTTRPVHIVRFNDYASGSEEDWLLGKGFQFEQDAKRRNYIDLEVADDRLIIEAKRPAFGILTNETVNVPTFSSVEIDWGVNTFPEGASYEQGIRNEAIMVIFFLGDERQPSGALFIPDCPYFVALFLCHGDDRVTHPYVGSYFKKSGRYVCGDRPAIGQVITTRFDLLAAYRSYFDKEGDDDPAISGIALALDTKKAAGAGRSSAFIREIRIY
ncbi:hypothetical protein JCM12296A_10490 [Desulfosarcina cetonica]